VTDAALPEPLDLPRVLLAGDVAARPEGLERALTRAGLRVTEASGELDPPPDALLITLDGGARESLAELLAAGGGPPRVVLFAGGGDPDLPGAALDLGAEDAVAAPVHLPELCARIHARIRERQAPRRTAYERQSREALESLVTEARHALLPDEIVLAMVRRLARAFGLAGCAYLAVESGDRGRIVAEVGRPPDLGGLDLRAWPEVLEALRTRRPTTMRATGPGPTIVLPVGEPAAHGALLLHTDPDRPPLAPAQLSLAGSLGEAAAKALVPAARGEAAAGLERRLQEEYERARRYALTFSLVLVTVDAMEEAVQQLDEEAGGQLVADVLAELRRALRLPDFVSRYTGEGFAIVLPETDVTGAKRSLNRIRERLSSLPLEQNGRQTALSAGIVGFPHPAVTQADDMFALVEAALRRGRAQVGERVGVAE
jgi:diguanylate cyclase (GGDEF)-like protein